VGSWRSQPGQDLVEYALIVAGIALVVLVGVWAWGGLIAAWFSALVQHIVTTGVT